MTVQCPHCKRWIEVGEEWYDNTIACPYGNCGLQFFLIRPKRSQALLKCLAGAIGGFGLGVVTGAAAGTAIPILGNIGCGIAGGGFGLLAGLATSCGKTD